MDVFVDDVVWGFNAFFPLDYRLNIESLIPLVFRLTKTCECDACQ